MVAISPAVHIQTKFGPLAVDLASIRSSNANDGQARIRKAVSVSGADLAGSNYKNTGVRINRGDVVAITAEGSLVMSPWGNNVTSTPEGGANFQWYIPNKIPGGALCGRIGTSGEEFKVGSKHSFTATRSGVLYLGVGMNSQFANQGYNFPGEYSVKIRVNAK